MIDEENVNQAIFEYAGKKYGKQSQEQFQGYVDEFPEKDWDLPDEQWLNNFLAWLFFEKVLQMKNIIRSKFIVISKKDLFFKVKDMNSGDIYNVKLGSARHIVPNAVITGRIYPFGDHYSFAGVFLISTSPFILDTDILMSAYENEGLKKIESTLLRKSSSLQSIMNKYPAHWIDWMCKHYGLKERLKKDKIQRIEDKIVNDLPQIVSKLPEMSREALAFCIKQGGVVKYGQLKNYDDDMDFFWTEENPVSTIGMLRQKGLMVVGKMTFGDRQFKVAFIPVEIREGLKSELKGYEG